MCKYVVCKCALCVRVPAGSACPGMLLGPGAQSCARLSSSCLLDPAFPSSSHYHCQDTSRQRWEMISISVSPTSLPWQKKPRKEGKGEHGYKPQDAVAAVSISPESV